MRRAGFGGAQQLFHLEPADDPGAAYIIHENGLSVKEWAYAFITGRRQAELDAAVSLIGKNVTAVQGDVSKLDDLDRRRSGGALLRLPISNPRTNLLSYLCLGTGMSSLAIRQRGLLMAAPGQRAGHRKPEESQSRLAQRIVHVAVRQNDQHA